jgi:hypothetical protein
MKHGGFGAMIIVALIWFPMRCHLAASGMASQMRSAMQSSTQSFAADHIALSFAFMIKRAT